MSAGAALYDRLGVSYGRTRQADPRIAARIDAALGDARSVVNVGAGTGSYEPSGRQVLAVDPSAVMLRQRPRGAAPAILAHAEDLPLVADAVDAALTVLSIHHWRDREAGMRELTRVARTRIVVLTWDPACRDAFWLTREYLPGVLAADAVRFDPPAQLAPWLGTPRIERVPIPADCDDGFLAAFWRRPEAYLNPDVRAGISTFSLLDPAQLDAGLARLDADLESGAWREAHAELLELDELDVGYRLIVWELSDSRRSTA